MNLLRVLAENGDLQKLVDDGNKQAKIRFDKEQLAEKQESSAPNSKPDVIMQDAENKQ